MKLVDDIILLTLQGPVSGWIDRIAEIAKRADIPIDLVNWNRNPRVLAMDIVGIADSSKKLTGLAEVVKELEQETLGLQEAEETATKILMMATKDKNIRPVAVFTSATLAEKYIVAATDENNSFKSGTLLTGHTNPVVLLNLDPKKLPVDPQAINEPEVAAIPDLVGGYGPLGNP